MTIVLAIILAGLLLIVSVFNHRLLMLLYLASLGWLPYEFGRTTLAPLGLDNALLAAVVLCSAPGFLHKGFRPGIVGWISILYWIMTIIANAISAFAPSAFVSMDPVPVIINQMVKDATVLGFILILEQDLRQRDFVPYVAAALIVAALGAAITTLFEYEFPGSSLVALWKSKKIAIAGGLQRYGGAPGESFISGAHLMGALGICIAILLYEAPKRLKVLALCGIPLFAVAVLAGQSRSTYVGIIVLMLCAGMSIKRFVPVVVLVGAGLFSVAAIPELWSRLFGRFGETEWTLSGRTDLWLHYFTHAPFRVFLFGEGYAHMSLRDPAGHSSYMEALADAGPIGVILFASFWVVVARARSRVNTLSLTVVQARLGQAAIWVSFAFLVSSAATGLVVSLNYRILLLTWLSLAIVPFFDERPTPLETSFDEHGFPGYLGNAASEY